MPYLAFNLNDGNEFIFDLLEDRLSLGRHASNDIVIDNTFISAHHAEFIRSENGGYELVDLKSSNGTFVNQKKIDRCMIKGGDRLRFGQLTAKFRDRPPKGLGLDQQTRPASQSNVKGSGQPGDHRGDTEAVPLPRTESSPSSKIASNPARSTPSLPSLEAAPPPGQAAALASLQAASADLARLTREKQAVETELTTAAKDRDERARIRSELATLQSDLNRAKGELAEAAEVTENLRSARRELANLGSKRESTQHELDRALADVEQARKSLETIHLEAEQARVKAADEQKTWQQQAEERQRHRSEFESSLATLKESIRASEADLKALEQRQIAIRETAEKDAQAAAEALRLERETTETAVAKLRQETEQLQDKLKSTEQKLDEKTTALTILDQKLANEGELGQKIQAKLAELAVIEGNKQSLQKILGDLTGERDQTTAFLEKLKAERVELETELPKLREKGRAQNTLLVSLKEQETSVRTLIEKEEEQSAKKIESSNAQIAELEQQKGILQQTVTDLTSQRDESQKRLETLRSELAGIEERMSLLRSEESAVSSRLTECRSQTEELIERGRQAETAAQVAKAEEQKAREEIKALEHLLTEKRSTLDAESAKRLTDLQATEQKAAAMMTLIASRQTEADELTARLDNAREGLKNAEKQRLQEEQELASLAARQQQLKREIGDLERLKTEASALNQSIQTLTHERSALEYEVAEFRMSGGQILTLAGSLAALAARKDEAERNLQRLSEQERAIKEQTDALQEELKRETIKLEKLRQEQAVAQKEFTEFATVLQREVSAMQQQEDDQKKRCATVQQELSGLEAKAKAQTAQLTALERTLTQLKQRETDYQEAEKRLQQWQQVEVRLRGQLVELEEKHELLRSGLATDESTVIMFANDLIKRIDLIDSLRQRYTGTNGSDIGDQLLTLRASFEDILLQHSVIEFEIEPGTEIDVDLRKRIAVVDSTPGKGKPRVVETYRSGFIFSREGSQEAILRKVEVRTSSQ